MKTAIYRQKSARQTLSEWGTVQAYELEDAAVLSWVNRIWRERRSSTDLFGRLSTG
jgi:hypothetical protein